LGAGQYVDGVGSEVQVNYQRVEIGNSTLVADAIRKLRGEEGVFFKTHPKTLMRA